MNRSKIAATNLFINLPIDAKMTSNAFLNKDHFHHTNTHTHAFFHMASFIIADRIVITLQLSTPRCMRYTAYKFRLSRLCQYLDKHLAFCVSPGTFGCIKVTSEKKWCSLRERFLFILGQYKFAICLHGIEMFCAHRRVERQ